MCGHGLVLRGVVPADEAAWRLLGAGYLAFYGADLAPAVTKTTWERLLEAGEPMRGIVAVLAGRPIGLAPVVLQASTWTVGSNAYLQDLFVSARYRRLGAARALIEAAVTCAASAGVTRLIWLTQEDNFTARALYDRIGAATGFIQYAAPSH